MIPRLTLRKLMQAALESGIDLDARIMVMDGPNIQAVSPKDMDIVTDTTPDRQRIVLKGHY